MVNSGIRDDRCLSSAVNYQLLTIGEVKSYNTSARYNIGENYAIIKNFNIYR